MLKEFEASRFDDNKIESSIQAEEKKEIKFVGAMRKVRGHMMFEYNYVTGVLLPAEYRKEVTLELKTLSLEDPTLQSLKRKIVVKDDCFYLQALNRMNAIKHLKRIRGFTKFL